MKKDYSRSIKLRCIVCGDDSCFTFNENQSYIKCERCGKEYHGGYDELVILNEQLITTEVDEVTEEITTDIQQELNKIFKKWK